jgi:hypothetical protein
MCELLPVSSFCEHSQSLSVIEIGGDRREVGGGTIKYCSAKRREDASRYVHNAASCADIVMSFTSLIY